MPSVIKVLPSDLSSITCDMSTSRSISRCLCPHLTKRSPRLHLPHPGRTAATPLASIRHASTVPPRTQSFTKPAEDHIKHLRSLLSSSASLLSTIDGSATADDLAGYNNDWMNKYHGKSPIVIKPKTTEEVSKVMKYCYDQGLAIVPQGGNTGLVGESISHRSCR